MNKPLRALLAVIVLAFAAAGLYYAWFAPTKPALEILDVRKQIGPKVSADEGKPLEDIKVQSTLAPAAPSSVSASSAPSAPSFAPTTAVPSSTPSNIPAGFAPDNAPMQPLPSNLPGFTPATASGVVVGTAVAGQSSSGTAASAPTTVSSTVKGGAPAASPAAKSSGTAPSPATIAPVPSSGGAVGATPSAVGKVQTPSATPATSPSVVPSSSPTSTTAAKNSATATPAATVHVVAAGDTLSSIAKQYWGTSQGWENIVKANPGLTPTTLKIGAKLNIPAKDAVIVKTTAAPAKSGATVAAGAAQDYEVVSGDTLSQISNKVYGDSKHWNLIYEANKKVIGEDPAELVVGTKLTIPAKPQSGVKTAPVTSPAKPS